MSQDTLTPDQREFDDRASNVYGNVPLVPAGRLRVLHLPCRSTEGRLMACNVVVKALGDEGNGMITRSMTVPH